MAASKMNVGEAVIEFYASLDLIKEYYEQKGYRKITLLHRELKKQLGWKMGYDTFRYHFNKEFKKIEKSTSTVSTEKDSSIPAIMKEENSEPIISRPSFSKAKAFNPHSSTVDEDRIIK